MYIAMIIIIIFLQVAEGTSNVEIIDVEDSDNIHLSKNYCQTFFML